MLSFLRFRDFNAEPELMPKTPSQKKNSRRKRVSLGRQEENQGKQRFVLSVPVFSEGSLKCAIHFCNSYIILSCLDTQRGGAVTFVALLLNHCNSLLKKIPFLRSPPLKPAALDSPNAPLAETNRQSLRW